MSVALVGFMALGCALTLASTSARAEDQSKVLIKDFMYAPMSMSVKAGTKVTWVNMDNEPHTVVSTTGLFRSGGLDTNDTFTYKFDKPGSYHVTCSIHPRMVGTIVVE